MNFLAPLFALGATAILGPIIFHLIRKTTREVTPFSTLMFLQPSPPRITRRSRLENLWLLLLRILAVALLAFAYTRPFLPRAMPGAPAAPGERLVLLVDTSASMRRGGLWTEAREKVAARLRAAKPDDELAVLTFDRDVHTVMNFAEWKKTPAYERAAVAEKRLAALNPGWGATHLDTGLLQAIEALDEAADTRHGQREIAVVTDLQEGARLDGLQGYQWARGLSVSIDPVVAKARQNAGLQWISESTEEAPTTGEESLRVRVTNAAEAKSEQFQLNWLEAPTAPAIKAYVPTGQSRVIRVPKPPSGATTLHLSGDDTDFDNTLYLLPPQATRWPLLFVGTDGKADEDLTKILAETQDPKGSLYFLRRAFPKTPQQNVEITVYQSEQPIPAFQLQQSQLLVLGETTDKTPLVSVRQFAQSGKIVVVPLASAQSAATLAQLLEFPAFTATEAPVKDYALLGQIDFTHPLFVPFADPRFSDFTKIHWWKHRRLTPASIVGAHVLARFDDGDPAILQYPLGQGSVVVLTSSWRPVDSQLALSSKFVPMLNALLEQSSRLPVQKAQYFVGDEVPVPLAPPAVSVRRPDGATVTVPEGAKFTGTDQPGIYTITPGNQRFVVNLAPDESRLAPLPQSRLTSLGVPLRTEHDSPADLARREGQAQAAEIESQQKLWRWLLIATIGVLLLETLIAGKLSRASGGSTIATT